MAKDKIKRKDVTKFKKDMEDFKKKKKKLIRNY